MKKFVVILLIVFLGLAGLITSNIAEVNGQKDDVRKTSEPTDEAANLFSADFCSRARFVCEPDSRYMSDKKGRCGCLTENDFMSAATCLAGTIRCDKAKGESFSEFYKGADLIGCGCFKTKR